MLKNWTNGFGSSNSLIWLGTSTMVSLFFLLFFALHVQSRNINGLVDPKANVCTGPFVELLISPVTEDGFNRRITFDWENIPTGAEIGIFTSDPSQASPTPVFSYTPTSPSGWGNTTLEETHLNAERLTFEAQCLGLYIAYHEGNGAWQGISCIRTEPTWMWDLREKIQDKGLRDIFIPGTHDASAYREWDPSDPDGLVLKYSVTQDEPYLGQLIYGARYLDLRPAHYPNSPEIWWGNHGIVQFHPLTEIFADIRNFLQNTNEVIILDAHEFPQGFDNDDVHRDFILFLEEQLGDLALPKSEFNYETPLREIWASGKRLVIGYNNGGMLGESDILWPAVNQQWGDVQQLPDLVNFLTGVLANPPPSEWSAMAQLTPGALDVIFDGMKGLRHAAEVVNHEMTAQFRNENWAKSANIVSMDFIRGSGIIRAAIQLNRGQAPC